MDIRLNKLVIETNQSLDDLVQMINDLGYPCDANPNCKVPEEVAGIIRGEVSPDFKSLLWKEIYAESQDPIAGFTKFAYQKDLTPHKAIKDVPLYNEGKHEFWIKELTFAFQSKLETIEVTSSSDSTIRLPYFSVLIGPNGVGKSTILREIVDFFLELHSSVSTDKTYHLPARHNRLCGIKYRIDGADCEVIRLRNRFLAKVNGCTRLLETLRLPTIVGCHFGAFEKLPIQTVNGSSSTKYDVPYYRYVGAHASNNMISSSTIAFRLLFALNGIMDERQRTNVKSILDFIGYDHRISLRYRIIQKSMKSGNARDIISTLVKGDSEYKHLTKSEQEKQINKMYSFYKDETSLKTKGLSYTVDFDGNRNVKDDKLNVIYKFKHYKLIEEPTIVFQKQGQEITSDEMSSGEFVMLAIVLSVSAAAHDSHTLVLLDEPELSQHPNWQMSLIDNLDMALKDKVCHVLLATHSHMVVSDLPSKRSCVTQLEKDKEGCIVSSQILEDTYGWSAEEVLLKVFKTATDRNRYFGERVGKLLERMGNNDINPDEVSEELKELQEVSIHLSDVDPMKMVLNTIIDTYSKA